MEVIKDECISKLEVVHILQKAYAEGRIKAKDGLFSVLDDINAADVQPVKRGKWEYGVCTNCNTPPDYFVSGDYWVDFKPDFCPNCGAEMRGDENG